MPQPVSVETVGKSRIIDELQSGEGSAVSVEDLIDRVEGIDDRQEAQAALRDLVNEGKISQTPNWNYKLATSLE